MEEQRGPDRNPRTPAALLLLALLAVPTGFGAWQVMEYLSHPDAKFAGLGLAIGLGVLAVMAPQLAAALLWWQRPRRWLWLLALAGPVALLGLGSLLGLG